MSELEDYLRRERRVMPLASVNCCPAPTSLTVPRTFSPGGLDKVTRTVRPKKSDAIVSANNLLLQGISNLEIVR